MRTPKPQARLEWLARGQRVCESKTSATPPSLRLPFPPLLPPCPSTYPVSRPCAIKEACRRTFQAASSAPPLPSTWLHSEARYRFVHKQASQAWPTPSFALHWPRRCAILYSRLPKLQSEQQQSNGLPVLPTPTLCWCRGAKPRCLTIFLSLPPSLPPPLPASLPPSLPASPPPSLPACLPPSPPARLPPCLPSCLSVHPYRTTTNPFLQRHETSRL